jgi:hypothetical protein
MKDNHAPILRAVVRLVRRPLRTKYCRVMFFILHYRSYLQLCREGTLTPSTRPGLIYAYACATIEWLKSS